ncbi:hypothetical protein E1B28_002775 [Marasmius oreades]|uniref:Uncharacterized protein n=1 Tax=Marasmius oreades TaxID=181124 RepID=A0A9P7UPA2_9AGAR|nr:uncharacterized protein E1B28_002775 [Marasmius oreades]KAG7086854.1 hypothetical protein E1B28_002775 [Marasmius oreades]
MTRQMDALALTSLLASISPLAASTNISLALLLVFPSLHIPTTLRFEVIDLYLTSSSTYSLAFRSGPVDSRIDGFLFPPHPVRALPASLRQPHSSRISLSSLSTLSLFLPSIGSTHLIG